MADRNKEMNADNVTTAKAWYTRWWVWALAVLLAIGIGSALSGTGTADDGADTAVDYQVDEEGNRAEK